MRAVVVGGGLAGLVAARDLARQGADVVLLEASERLGGQLRTEDGWGDVGAEAFLVRRPDVLQLVLELGLAGQVVHPSPVARPHVLTTDGLAPLPGGTVLGIPSHLRQLRGVVSLPGIARAAADLWLPHHSFPVDVTVGGFARQRLGREVVDTLIDPLLGGVYSGVSDSLSLAAVAPGIAVAEGRSLMRRARQVPSSGGGPVFGALRDGFATLLEAMTADLGRLGVDVRTGVRVERIDGAPGAWSVDGLTAAGVVLATRADVAARLLARVAPEAAAWSGATPYAHVAVVTLVWPRDGAGRLAHGDLSGWLVPPSQHRLVKAATVLTSKWPHLAERWPDHVVVRASVGRFGDDSARGDELWMTGVAAAEVAEVGRTTARVERSRVTRWDPALPQYLVGHSRRVRELRAQLPVGLAVAGAAWDGVGLPAVVASARRAAVQVGESGA